MVVGSPNADIYVEIERLPKEGETISAQPRVLQFGRMCVGEFVVDDGNREDKRKIRQMYLVLVMVAIGWFRWDLFVVCSSDSATSNLPCLIWDLLLLLFYNED